MTNRLIDGGKIVNTHGIKGEVKIVHWCDSAEFLCSFDTLYIDEKPVKVIAARPHKNNIIALLSCASTIDDAMRLKGKMVQFDRDSAPLPEGSHFLKDLMGLRVIDAKSAAELGVITDILTPPSHNVYIVDDGKHMIPAVPEFVKSVDLADGKITVELIEGM